ncbi:MAG TPA: VOC family protein [Candidatus Cybelea sp.]|jgi:predicted enzyme related to lactoylglutathione lyase|nr:VOC family protein [Candidatus Cybelea sp.]
MNETQVTSSKTAITGIDLAAYLVKDPDRAIAFYRDVLGMAPTAVDDQGRGAEFTLPDGSTFGVWKPDDGGTGGAIMFAVDDARAAVEHYRGRGLQLSDVMESPVCHMAFGTDPEGNAIIIHQRKVRD